MRVMTLGAIAIASTLTFACTTTTIDRTETTGSTPNGASQTSHWQSKLALSRPSGVAKTISALATKGGKKPGISLPGGGGPDGGKCGLSSGDATCDTCIDASCCAENAACVSDADCTALISCGDACRDDACVSACMSAHPGGAAKLNALTSCMQSGCASACGGGGGGGGGGSGPSACGFGSGDATCDSCLDTNCCADANACTNDADCTALMDCAERCADDACEAACEAAHPSGTAKLNSLSACANNTCGSACSGAAGGPGPGPAPDPGGASCGLTSGDAACDTCLNASCCTQTTTCVDDADCVALVRCYDACADDACAAACDSGHPGGLSKLDAVSTCAETTCKSQCGF